MVNKYEKSSLFCEMRAPLIDFKKKPKQQNKQKKQPTKKPTKSVSVLQKANSLLPWSQITIVTLDTSVFLD